MVMVIRESNLPVSIPHYIRVTGRYRDSTTRAGMYSWIVKYAKIDAPSSTRQHKILTRELLAKTHGMNPSLTPESRNKS
jgi:hypothetical protein